MLKGLPILGTILFVLLSVSPTTAITLVDSAVRFKRIDHPNTDVSDRIILQTHIHPEA